MNRARFEAMVDRGIAAGPGPQDGPSILLQPAREQDLQRESFPAFGGHAVLLGRAETGRFEDLVLLAVARLTEAERRFTLFDATSELSMLRNGEVSSVSPDMRRVLDGCRLLEAVTDGAFRVKDPNGLPDTSGFVKGWALQQLRAEAEAEGFTDWVLRTRGDVVASGTNAGRPWQVGVLHPGDPGVVAQVLDLGNGAAATSDGRPGPGIWGRDGRIRRRAGSCTVVGPRIDIADGLATAMMAHGCVEPEWLARLPEYSVLFVRPDGTTSSQGLA